MTGRPSIVQSPDQQSQLTDENAFRSIDRLCEKIIYPVKLKKRIDALPASVGQDNPGAANAEDWLAEGVAISRKK